MCRYHMLYATEKVQMMYSIPQCSGSKAEQQAYGQQDKSIHVCSTRSVTNGRAQREDAGM